MLTFIYYLGRYSAGVGYGYLRGLDFIIVETLSIFAFIKIKTNMKNIFVGLTAALVGVQLVACAGEKELVQTPEKEYVIVVHG